MKNKLFFKCDGQFLIKFSNMPNKFMVIGYEPNVFGCNRDTPIGTIVNLDDDQVTSASGNLTVRSSNSEFPKLLRSKNPSGNYIVLFNGPISGVVICDYTTNYTTNYRPSREGEYSTSWVNNDNKHCWEQLDKFEIDMGKPEPSKPQFIFSSDATIPEVDDVEFPLFAELNDRIWLFINSTTATVVKNNGPDDDVRILEQRVNLNLSVFRILPKGTSVTVKLTIG